MEKKLLKKNYKLTAREKDIVRLIRECPTHQAIADNLGISRGVVRNYINNLRKRFEVDSSIALFFKVNELDLMEN